MTAAGSVWGWLSGQSACAGHALCLAAEAVQSSRFAPGERQESIAAQNRAKTMARSLILIFFLKNGEPTKSDEVSQKGYRASASVGEGLKTFSRVNAV